MDEIHDLNAFFAQAKQRASTCAIVQGTVYLDGAPVGTVAPGEIREWLGSVLPQESTGLAIEHLFARAGGVYETVLADGTSVQVISLHYDLYLRFPRRSPVEIDQYGQAIYQRFRGELQAGRWLYLCTGDAHAGKTQAAVALASAYRQERGGIVFIVDNGGMTMRAQGLACYRAHGVTRDVVDGRSIIAAARTIESCTGIVYDLDAVPIAQQGDYMQALELVARAGKLVVVVAVGAVGSLLDLCSMPSLVGGALVYQRHPITGVPLRAILPRSEVTVGGHQQASGHQQELLAAAFVEACERALRQQRTML